MAKEIKCIYEEFTSINQLLNTLNSRPNNQVMSESEASRTGDRDFCETSSYEEAVDLFVHGYTDIVGQVRAEVRKNNKAIYSNPIERRTIMNMPVGFIPNVPNALQNKPDSMINIVSTPQKRKTLSVIYAMGGSCGEEAESFIKAGAALVSALNLIELSGVQTRLYVDFMPSSGRKEMLSPVLRVKNYGERFNLTKICFPLVHPSMFRRIGFKYLETCPFVTDDSFRLGYGRLPEIEDLRRNIPTDKQTFILNTKIIKNNAYSVKAILEELKFFSEKK